MKRISLLITTAVILLGVLTGCQSPIGALHQQEPKVVSTLPSPVPVITTVPTEPLQVWELGYLAGAEFEIAYFDEAGSPVGTLQRGTQVDYTRMPDGRISFIWNDQSVYLPEDTSIVSDPDAVIPAYTLYVRTAVNLRDIEGRLLAAFVEKGTPVEIIGCDYLLDDGSAHMYRVRLGDEEGYMMPWYLTDTEEAALANYDDGSYAVHAARGNLYGGGSADNLDYYPREKGPIAGNEMPSECRTLYLTNWCLGNLDAYLEIADNSGINAFVVDIVDGGSIGYAADVMKKYCPTGANAAQNTVESYQAAIRKIKDAGYYVIGRITTFNDSCFVKDHPEYAIADKDGAPLKLSGEYWPTAFSREAWQYKVDLAVEAVELMGFHEIQFDYVRFPDSTWRYEENDTIDFRNAYNETKAQAIQRFLMYATDILHEQGVYVSADVYGESAYHYVTAYGQYWAAISNVVDAISGMPYPDHFGASDTWLPWEHPYETLYSWGQSVMTRQSETATPAAVRTWIQAYNAIRKPYNAYGPTEVGAQIRGLRDAGCTGGYMTWNAVASIDKYTQLMSAFAPPSDDAA